MNTPGNGRTVADVVVDVTVESVDDRGVRQQIDAVLGYRRADPYAVTMTFVTGAGNLVWTFGRDLLTFGVTGPAGDGDVRVAPAIGHGGRAVVDIELSSPNGHLTLQVSTHEVVDFVRRAHLVVPAGTEGDHLDLDGLVEVLLDA